jgi:hypothetical protein
VLSGETQAFSTTLQHTSGLPALPKADMTPPHARFLIFTSNVKLLWNIDVMLGRFCHLGIILVVKKVVLCRWPAHMLSGRRRYSID